MPFALPSPLRSALALCAVAALPLAAQAQATLSAVPASGTVAVGSPLSVAIDIGNVTDLYAYQFTLSFNAAVLQATGVVNGSFLDGAGTTFFDAGSIDNTAGTVSFVVGSLIGPIAGATGSGPLASVSFNVTGFGSSTLTLSDVLALDSTLGDITLQITGGAVTAVPEPGAWLMFSAGLLGMAGLRLRRGAA